MIMAYFTLHQRCQMSWVILIVTGVETWMIVEAHLAIFSVLVLLLSHGHQRNNTSSHFQLVKLSTLLWLQVRLKLLQNLMNQMDIKVAGPMKIFVV